MWRCTSRSRELRQRPGAPEAEEVWLRGTAWASPVYLTGEDAEAARRATRSPSRWSPGTRTCGWWTQIIALALAAAGITLDGADARPATAMRPVTVARPARITAADGGSGPDGRDSRRGDPQRHSATAAGTDPRPGRRPGR